jgi:hypothetical protein
VPSVFSYVVDAERIINIKASRSKLNNLDVDKEKA